MVEKSRTHLNFAKIFLGFKVLLKRRVIFIQCQVGVIDTFFVKLTNIFISSQVIGVYFCICACHSRGRDVAVQEP